ncbi:MAG TPA: prolipoprotein diacylglyceryl transferase [Azospirillaceae bacterium]|nr:prolipoprotein diacylglyceryl transferase [Azospirillaceae bacterium]
MLATAFPAIAFPVVDPVAFAIGPVAIRWYALAYLAGFLLGWRYCLHLGRRRRGRRDAVDFDDFLTWAVVGAVLGGRVGYVLFYNLPHYLENPLEIFMVWLGGMSFHGGLLGVILAILLFCRSRDLSPFAFGDIIACAAPIGLFFGRIANFINGELYGRAAPDFEWAMVFPRDPLQIPRHPSQLYEAALEGALLFVVLAFLVRRQSVAERPGLLAGIFLVGYGLARGVVELFREPDAQLGFLWGGATMGQLLCVPMIAVGVWMAARSGRDLA